MRPSELDDREWLLDAYGTQRRSTTMIARELGTSDGVVRNALHRLDIPVRSRKESLQRFSELGDREWLEGRYLDEGLSARQIADRLGCTQRSVLNAMEQLGIQRRSPNGRLAWDDVEFVETVRGLYESGLTQEQLADRYGVHRSTMEKGMKRHSIQPRKWVAPPTVFPGDRFDRLTVLQEAEAPDKDGRYYLCRCDCGTEKVVWGAGLSCGQSKSCGCLQRERAAVNGAASLRKAMAAKRSRYQAVVRDVARQLRSAGTIEVAEAAGVNPSTALRHLKDLAQRGTVEEASQSVRKLEWAFQKPMSPEAAPKVRVRKPKNYSGAGPSGRAQLPPTKELREVALEYGGKCRALPNGHYELALANGQKVTLAGTPTNAGGAAKAARAEIERKLAA